MLDGERVYTFGVRTENGALALLGNEICDLQRDISPIDTPQMNRVLSDLFTKRNPVVQESSANSQPVVLMPRLQIWAMEKQGIYAAMSSRSQSTPSLDQAEGGRLTYARRESSVPSYRFNQK